MSARDLAPRPVAAVSGEAMHVWAELLGDPNPIHVDPAAAAALGFGPRTVNQGPANLAYVINMLSANFPDARIVSLEAHFLGNVLSGDRVEAVGQQDAAGEAIACTADLLLNDGASVLRVAARLANEMGGDDNAA